MTCATSNVCEYLFGGVCMRASEKKTERRIKIDLDL